MTTAQDANIPPAPEGRRRLPIGIQTFRKLREGGYYYVDKTGLLGRLVDGGTHYFLSRPRRFGKSLLVDTLKEMFEGNRPLFEGLAIHDRWDWTARHPVVRLDFGAGDFDDPEHLPQAVLAQFDAAGEDMGVATRYDIPSLRFQDLLKALHVRKVSLFSGLNNLQDITLDPRYATICGYAETDLDAVFAPELPGLDRNEVRDWYDGYGWAGAETVYNPFDILLLFDRREFGAYWFETGTPAFLLDTLVSRGVEAFALDDLFGSDELLSSFDMDDVAPEALLFQTGYLTIREVESVNGTRYYRLGYPNREVRQSLNRSLLRRLVRGAARGAEPDPRLLALLRGNDFAGLERLFRAFFAGIPHQWHTNNDIARYEGYYASVFYACFAALGLDVRVEDSTNRGRLDLAVLLDAQVYLFEFKVAERASEGAALAQLLDRRYADKYRGLDTPIHLIGVEFSQATRSLTAFDVAAG